MSWQLLLTIALGMGAAVLATRLKVPSGSILGPMVVIGGLQLSEAVPLAHMPSEWRFVALVVIGMVVGTAFTRAAVVLMAQTIRVAALGVLAVVLFGLAAAQLLTRVSGMPLITSMLGLSPGGASEMAAVALDFQSDAGVVAALHMVRQISVLLSYPFVFRILMRGHKKNTQLESPLQEPRH